MFQEAPLFNGDVSKWDTGSVINMNCWLQVAVFPCLVPWLLSLLLVHVQCQCRLLSPLLQAAVVPVSPSSSIPLALLPLALAPGLAATVALLSGCRSLPRSI
eukprot:1373848-Rhodomonas_salina.1